MFVKFDWCWSNWKRTFAKFDVSKSRKMAYTSTIKTLLSCISYIFSPSPALRVKKVTSWKLKILLRSTLCTSNDSVFSLHSVINVKGKCNRGLREGSLPALLLIKLEIWNFQTLNLASETLQQIIQQQTFHFDIPICKIEIKLVIETVVASISCGVACKL